MISKIEFVFLTLTVFTGRFWGEQIQETVGNAIKFILPPYPECGAYSLIGPYGSAVINIVNATQCDVMQLYLDRGSCKLQVDWSFWFALHRLAKRDEGKYVLRGGPRTDSIECRLEQWTEVIVQEAEWLAWGSWSRCSQTCGRGYRTRSRDCSQPMTCGEGARESEECELQPCHIEERTSTIQRRPSFGHWSYWSDWSHCSRTCAEGQKTRSRDCLDERSNTLPTGYCEGDKTETDICKDTDCSIAVARNNQVTSSSGDTPSVPLYGVVGAGAGLFIIVLVVVIVVLVMKLKRRRRVSISSASTTMVKQAQKKRKYTKRKQSRVISLSVSGVHLYDEINDDDVNCENSECKAGDRSSVMTLDNPYVVLPRSPNPAGQMYPQNQEYGNVAYSNTSNTVTMFSSATSPENNGIRPESSELFPEETDQFNGDIEGPRTSWYNDRHKSVDSVGYTISANERARRKRYVK